MLERDRTYNDVLDRIERLEIRVEDLRDVARPSEVVTVENPSWQEVAGWTSTGTVLQDVNARIVLDPTIPRILLGAGGIIESADYVAGTSGFHIDGGTAEFNDVVIRGTIYASVGIIGGWTITANQIKAVGDVIILDSAGIITVGGAGYLQSNPFTSGAVGWRITPTEAEFENITARGEIRTAVFKYNEIHAQAGQLLVTPNAAKLDADLTVAANGSFNVGEAGRFGVDDIVRLKDGTGDVWLKITADNGDGTYNYSRQSGSAPGMVFRAGTAVVGYGAAGEGGVLLDAVSANGPFMDIFTHAGTPWAGLTTKVRVGNLVGIVDPDLNPTGYGFYSDNAYLKGALVAGGGSVIIDANGLDIDLDQTGAIGHVKFRDFTAAEDGWAVVYAWSDPLVNLTVTGYYQVQADQVAGAAVNALAYFEVRGKGQSWLHSGTDGNGLLLYSMQVPNAALTGAWLNAAAMIARVSASASGNRYATLDLLSNGEIQITSRSGTNKGTIVTLGDAAGTAKLSVKDSAAVEVASIDSNGEVRPDADGRGFFTRFVNRLGIQTYTNHFRSGVIPTGFTWRGAPFGGTPALLYYSIYGDYFASRGDGAGTRHFLADDIANNQVSWNGKSIWGRIRTGLTTEIGLRVDDGTDNNYAEIYVTGVLANATQRLDFRYRTGGGAVTTVASGLIFSCDTYVVVQLYTFLSAGNWYAYGLLVGEDSDIINITGFNTGAVGWMPAAGRVGIMVKNQGNLGFCDWFHLDYGL